MAGKKDNKKTEQYSLFSKNHLLSIILFLLIYILVGQIQYVFNSRSESSNIRYDNDSKCYYITDEIEAYSSIYLDKHWMLFPNVTSENIRFNMFDSNNYSFYPHAEDVSISNSFGWNELGSGAKWYHATNSDHFKTLKDRNGNPAHIGAYLIKIHTASGAQSLNINIPEISGSADIYCNGVLVNPIADTTSTMGLNFYANSFENTGITTDSNGDATIIIVVTTNSRILNPGILSIPSLSTQKYDTIGLSLSSAWYTILGFSFLGSIIVGAIISRTFTHKGKFYLLLLTEVVFIAYTLLDSKIILLYSPILDILKYALIIILGILSYCTLEVFFENGNTIKKHVYFKFDFYIHTAIGVLLTLILIFKPNLLFTNYPLISAGLFTIIGTLISIAKIFVFYNKDNLSTVAINMYITTLCCFLYMFNQPITIVNIKPYTSFYVIGITSLELLFILKYVQQQYELRNYSERLAFLVKEKTLHISEINRDLYNTNKKLIENEEARKNVLSNVSHDLRTPITAIRGYAELLLASSKTMREEQVQLYLQNIVKRSVQMERIVSDIVELTRMESNKDEFKFNDIALAELLDEIYMMYEGEVRGTKKRITLEIPDDDLLIVKADYKKLSRVFENLISNSINYTYDEALIEIRAWREGTDLPLSEQKIHVTIKDNGIGIPEEEVTHIFDRFYRAKNSGKNIKGTGLGLSIVYTIIKNHDADITVESKLGSGTTFHIVMNATY